MNRAWEYDTMLDGTTNERMSIMAMIQHVLHANYKTENIWK